MKRICTTIVMMALAGAIFAKDQSAKQTAAGNDKIFTVTASTSQSPHKSMNISWATGKDIDRTVLEVTKAKDKNWKRVVSREVTGTYCTTYDSIYSKKANGENFYEDVKINRYTATAENLKKNTRYKYRIIAGNDTSEVRYFNTANPKKWDACIISDFHVYSPLYHRTKSAMDMMQKVKEYGNPFQWVLHLGDITAWGGSYSFWKNLYKEQMFKDYMWAGVNGNHDNMTRTNKGNTNKFFRDAAAYPHNGYEGEMGVCYWFKYGDVLFIMLNNESMRSQEGLEAAQKWVRKVVEDNPAPYKVVCEHYQWFNGKTGKEAQYSRWHQLFDELGISLALAGNNHIYVSTLPIYNGEVAEPGKGTVYVQSVSSDNERGEEWDYSKPLEFNTDRIKFRWGEGPQTVGGMHLNVTKKKMTLTLLDRNGKVMDVTEILPKR